MESEDDTPPRICAGCQTAAPITNTDYSLIGSRYGWRIRRYMVGDTPTAEWWCPTCWADLKKAGGGIASLIPGGRPTK